MGSTGSNQDHLPRLSRLASGFVVAVGAAVLLGWVLDIPRLILLLPTIVPMNPATAVLFILSGIALWRLGPEPGHGGRAPDIWGRVLAGVVMLGGTLKLVDYVFGLPVHVDQLLFPDRLGLVGRPFGPSAMGPNTALNFILCGAALLLFEAETRRGWRPGQVLALLAGLVAVLALMGYTYHVLSLYEMGKGFPMALDTAIAFAVFCLGFLAARPRQGIMSLVTSATTGGSIARRLLPMAIIVPWVLGAVLLLGEQAGYYERESAVSFFAVASLIIFTGLLWWNAKLLYWSDIERMRNERRMTVQHAVTRILAESSTLNEAAPRILQTVCQTLGWPMGALWMLEPGAHSIQCRHTWHVPATGLAEFAEKSRHQALSLGMGVPGRVWAAGHPVLSTDALPAEGCPRSDVAEAAGLRAAFGFPIRLGEEMFGVMEFFTHESQEPDDILVEVLSGVGSQIGQFIERTRAEEQLRQTTADLQRSNTDLQQFASVASHDLTEPLRMIASYLQLLNDRYGKQLESQAKEFLGFAVDGAKRMQALIQDLLAYSRVDLRGRSLEPTDLEQVFRTAVTNLKVAIEESGAVIHHQPLPRVMADAIQLTQVFQNLLGNGIKFRGTEAPRLEVGVERRGEEWRFSVHDNGIGIEAKDFERLFVIFQRLHTRQEYAGTGMGLAICKKILERHGGRVWVESVPGKGSSFFFTLPVMKEG